MKRIFMIGYSGGKGGVETYMDQLKAALPQDDIIYSLPVMTIDGREWRRPPNRHRYISYRLFWRRFFRENHFDALYFNTCDLVSIDMLRFAKKAGISLRLIHAHNSGIQQAIGQKLSLFHRLTEKHNRKVLGRYATHFLACSQAAGDWMFGGRPYTILRNGIDLSLYRFSEEKRRALRRELGMDRELLVGIVGRLAPQKNPAFSVKVLQSLLRKDPTAHAVFLGEGELRTQTEKAVRDAGLQENVRFLGNVDHVNEWVSALDVLLMPSLFEGLPFALVEAQAGGLPCVVSSAVTGEADLTGLIRFISLEEAPEAWADMLLQSKAAPRPDTERRMTEAGYSIENTARIVSNMLQEAD